MVSTDRNFLDPDYDEYSMHHDKKPSLLSTVAIIFMVLLILRHTLPIIISGPEEYSLTLFMLLLLRTAGILLPVYIMVRAVTAIQHRRSQQDRESLPLSSSEGEDEQLHLQPQPHVIRVH
ncbi:hypothetical protein IFM89_015229 [Coptis chinensis]|uniref:Uncharacterized protein n=1 Tax=Coptis chinensis TaxID=261450 RepID=A0A835H364_9MAGN|nr:hypothetical protein IFM89_015229 [Coptis chinensis]